MVHIEESMQVPRDFEGMFSISISNAHDANSSIGFGEEGFDPKWPNGARIAVSFVLNYEYAPIGLQNRLPGSA